MELTPQYIAGFMDGEAYFGIIRKTDYRSFLGHFYKACIKIAQVESSSFILQLLKNRYGGNISKTRKYKNPNQRPSIMLEITNGIRIKKVLDEIQPFLIVKSKQADILRKFINLPKQNEVNRLEVDAMRSELYRKILSLNKRGLAETERKDAIKGDATVRTMHINESIELSRNDSTFEEK